MQLQSRMGNTPVFSNHVIHPRRPMALSSRSSERLKRASGNDGALLSLLQAASLGCVQIDPAGNVRDWNASAERMLGWKAEEVVGKPFSEIYQGDDDEYAGLVTVRARNGESLKVEIWSAPHPDGTSRVLLLQDVTEKKFLEKALLEAAEREQRRIGQELHDGLCQHLLGAAFSAKALAGALDREQSAQAPQLHDLARLINDAVSQVRDVSRGLHPVEQDAAGLMSALQELAGRSKQQIVLECDKRVLVSDASKARNAYRIAQETVAALQQAGSHKIVMSLGETNGSVRLRLDGDGRKESELTANPAGVAARILHYRAQALQGSVSLNFDPEHGTHVTCIFPS